MKNCFLNEEGKFSNAPSWENKNQLPLVIPRALLFIPQKQYQNHASIMIICQDFLYLKNSPQKRNRISPQILNRNPYKRKTQKITLKSRVCQSGVKIKGEFLV